ncbi:MAG: DUF5680 domain-containing protein [Dehalococcoidia bacterium]
MNVDGLRGYLNILAREGYAATDGSKNPDGSATISHSSGPWRTCDTYFGGEPYGGSEVVFYADRPVWMMVYYGAVEKDVPDVSGTYRFLKAALANTDPAFPLRGPRSHFDGGLCYENTWEGDLNRFSGVERIVATGREVYSATYCGGLVDQRAE